MYLFNREMRLAPGNLLDSLAWAAKVTEKVNAVGGPEVRLWSRVLGPDVGTLSWSTVIVDIAELMVLEEKLMADGGYVELVEQGARFGHDSGAQDSLGRLAHADPDGFDTAQYVSITTTRLAPGMTATGVALGVELAQQVKAITGRPTSFATSATGPFGAVAFFALSETIEQVQAANEALSADADWLAALDERASKAYVAASSEQMIIRRLA